MSNEKLKRLGDETAFPCGDHTWGNAGLTKREWFAGMALQGILSDRPVGDIHISTVVAAAQLADALIAELNKETEDGNS